jgi:hypothetical protein
MSIRNRITAGLAAVTVAFALGACSDDAPTNANDTAAPGGQQAAPDFLKASKLLKNVPVTATATDGSGRVFPGKVSITEFGYVPTADPTKVQLVVSGKLQLDDGGVQRFSNIPASLVAASSAGLLRIAPAIQGSCSILDLDIGAIHLDLLGLVVDLAPIHLDITGQTGAGNLLGNLLCALAGLLDPSGIGPLTGLLTDLINLLEQINDILAGL